MSISHQAVGAYRRWEPADFDAPPEPEAAPEPPPAPEPAAEPEQPAIQLPTADEIEAMFEQARSEGQAAGYAEGAARAGAEAERLAGLAGEVDRALMKLDEDVAEELVGLAVEIARQMVRHSLAVQPDSVVDTVREALQQLPQGQARIHLHPEDLALMRAHLPEGIEQGHHRLVEDRGITRGGCRIEGSASEIDATVETRWRRILEGLGRNGPAWEPD